MSYTFCESTEKIFQNILNESILLNEKRIELQNKHPVTRDEIIRFLDNSDRIQWRGKYNAKKLRIYINSTDSNGQERYDLLGEVEPTSIGYILHGRDGYCYQGESYEDFKNDMIDAIRHFDSNVFDTLGGSGEDVLNKDFKEAAYALGKLRLYCGLDEIPSRWDHDDNDLPYIVDSKNTPPLFTVKWVDTEEHPKSYAVSDEKTTEFFSDKESAYKKIIDILSQSSALEEAKDQLFDNILNEAVNPRFVIRATFDCDGVEKRVYYNSMLDNWVSECFPKGQEFGATQFKNEPSEEKLEYVKTVMKEGTKETLDCDDPHLVKLEVLTFLITKRSCKLVDKRIAPSTLLEGKGDFKKNAFFDKAGYALTKLKGYLRYDTRWEYAGDGEPYLVDNVNEPPLYTVQWTGTESGSSIGYYSIEVEQDGDWDSTVYNFSDVRSTYQKIEDIMRPSSVYEEARVFPHSSGFGLSLYDKDDYEPTIINKVKYYPFSVEDDGEKYYFDKHGNSVKHIWNAICFGTKEEALDFGNKYLIFGELDVEEVIKTEQVLDESKINLFNSLLEAIDDFPKNTRAMYRFAKRKHDDTKAIRKVSKEPYWVHPEGVAKIVMEHGGSDVEIKAAMAHDTMEDAGVDYDDMEEKFGEKVASIVKEVTNDKFEIARVGKEKYISEELCRLSPEALTVKLADMLYNMKDLPTESNYERMRKNIAFLMMNRQLDGVHLALAEEILEV